jgi:hypothetical protein
VRTPTRSHPHISVEEVHDEKVIMRVFAVPEIDREGPKLADEILAAIGRVTGRDGNGNGTSAGDGHRNGNGGATAEAEPPPQGETGQSQGDRVSLPRA